jgi:hypothetical protein
LDHGRNWRADISLRPNSSDMNLIIPPRYPTLPPPSTRQIG